jgi:hypothetical protein
VVAVLAAAAEASTAAAVADMAADTGKPVFKTKAHLLSQVGLCCWGERWNRRLSLIASKQSWCTMPLDLQEGDSG